MLMSKFDPRATDRHICMSYCTYLTIFSPTKIPLQRFPLGGDDEVMSSTLQQFAKVIDEVREGKRRALWADPRPVVWLLNVRLSSLLQLSSCHAVLSTQLADAMMFPITQFKERDLKGRRTCALPRPRSLQHLFMVCFYFLAARQASSHFVETTQFNAV